MLAQELPEPAREITTATVPTDVMDRCVTDSADEVNLCPPCNDGAASKAQVVAVGESTSSGCGTDQISVRPNDSSLAMPKLELHADCAAAAPDEPLDRNDEISSWQVAPQYRQPPNGVLTYQLCRHYKGPQTCQYGDACSFAHGEKELAVWVSLQAMNVDASYIKDDSAVVRSQRPGNYVLCRMFLNGGCDMGKDCTFAHSVKELKEWNATAADVTKSTKRTTATSTKLGPQSLLLDSNTSIRPPPTRVMCAFQLCKYLRSGVCPRGVECPFAHSTAELRAWSKARRKQRQMTAKTIMNDLSQSTEKTEGESTMSTPKKVRPPPVGLTMMPQLCSYFTESHCEKGYFCSFAHSVEELRAWETARQRGHITRPYPRHVQGPMILCKDGIDLCPQGSMCPQAHSEAELESWHAQRDAEMTGARLRHANSFRIRPRPFGFSSQFQLCLHFKAGRCTNSDCTFAHSEAERVAWESDRKAEKQHRLQQRSPQLSPQHGQNAALNGGAPAGSAIMVGDRYLGSVDGHSYDLSRPGSPGPLYAPAPVPMSQQQHFAIMQQMRHQMQQMQAMQQQQQQQQAVGPVMPMFTPPTSPVRHPMYVQVPNSPPSFDLAVGMDMMGPVSMGHGMPQSPLAGYGNYMMVANADTKGALSGRAPNPARVEGESQDARPGAPEGGGDHSATVEAAGAAHVASAATAAAEGSGDMTVNSLYQTT